MLFSEFGLPTSPEGHSAPEASESMLVEERVAADYTDRALTELRRAGATGAMLWCANDYVSDIWDAPPLDEAAHERSFGLWRADGSPKPSVERIQSHRSLEVVAAPADLGWIDIEPAEFYKGGSSQLARLYQRYSERVLSET